MRSSYTLSLEEPASQNVISLKTRSKSVNPIVQIGRHSSLVDLANIKIGCNVRSDSGIKGKVCQIDIVELRYEHHHYFRLENGAGTILIIK